MADPALQYIKEAAGLPITNTERFEYVVDRLKKDYPDAKGDFIRTVVQATFTKWADSFK
jgi:chorismate mutase